MSNEEADRSDGDEPLEEEPLDIYRDARLAVVWDRPSPQPPRAVWNGDGETVERIVSSISDRPDTDVEPEAVSGERAAKPKTADFDSFYLAHKLTLLAKLIPFCANDRHLAEDVVQETFLVAYNHRDELPELNAPAAWLYKVATRVAMDYFKRESLRKERTHAPCTPRQTPAEPDQPVLLTDLLHRPSDPLTPQELQVVWYRYVLDYDRKRIAKEMGISLRTVDNRIRAALTKLQRHVAQAEEDES